MPSVLDFLTGGPSALVTGVEDQSDGLLRVYVGARYHGVYILIDNDDDKQAIRRAWADISAHVFIPMPDPDQLHKDNPDG